MGNVYKEYTPPESASGLYHKFEDGVTYRFRIASEPAVFETSFPAPDGTENVSGKYAWVVWNVDKKMVQVLQLPVTGYKQIAALASDDEYGDPTTYDLKITRTGSGFDTKYEVIAGRTTNTIEEAYPDAVEAIKKVDLIDALSASDKNQNVNWLADAVAGRQTKTPLSRQQVDAADFAPSDDEADEKIDLSTIPF